MFDPAGLGKDLPKFLLGDGNDSARVIENDGARTGGPLIKSQHVFHNFNSKASVDNAIMQNNDGK